MSNRNTAAADIANKAKEVITEDARKAEVLIKDAVKSRAYLYPIKGIYYFLAHKELWKPLLSQLLPTIGTATGVTAFMFIVTYVPQAAVLALVNGPLAIFSTILLVLSESATLTNIIARAMFLEDKLLDTFDATLLERDQSVLVSNGRELKGGRGSADVMSRLGKLAKRPFARFTPKAIIRYLIYLPLNAIPLVGTILFVLLQGRSFGPNAHARYFQLKGYNARQKEEIIEKRRAAYTSFGVPAVLLEMVPFVGIFFAFTNTVGSALWAADLEKSLSAPQSARLREDELPPQETGVVRDDHKKEL